MELSWHMEKKAGVLSFELIKIASAQENMVVMDPDFSDFLRMTHLR